MAVAFVDSGIAGSDAGSTFPTASVTGSSSDGLALIALGWFDGTETITPTGTVGGSSTGVVQIGSTFSVSGGAFRMALFYKVAPGTGTLSLAGTLSASADNLFTIGAVYSGVDQSTPVGSLATAAANSTSVSVSPSGGTASGMVVAFAQSFFSALTSTAGTEREQLYRGSVDKTAAWGDLAGASGAVSWSQTSALWGAIGVALNEASGGGGELTWLPRQTVATGRGPKMVASGMTPPGRVA